MSPLIYSAATILHPPHNHTLDTMWAVHHYWDEDEKDPYLHRDWLRAANKSFQKLYRSYKDKAMAQKEKEKEKARQADELAKKDDEHRLLKKARIGYLVDRASFLKGLVRAAQKQKNTLSYPHHAGISPS